MRTRSETSFSSKRGPSLPERNPHRALTQNVTNNSPSPVSSSETDTNLSYLNLSHENHLSTRHKHRTTLNTLHTTDPTRNQQPTCTRTSTRYTTIIILTIISSQCKSPFTSGSTSNSTPKPLTAEKRLALLLYCNHTSSSSHKPRSVLSHSAAEKNRDTALYGAPKHGIGRQARHPQPVHDSSVSSDEMHRSNGSNNKWIPYHYGCPKKQSSPFLPSLVQWTFKGTKKKKRESRAGVAPMRTPRSAPPPHQKGPNPALLCYPLCPPAVSRAQRKITGAYSRH